MAQADSDSLKPTPSDALRSASARLNAALKTLETALPRALDDLAENQTRLTESEGMAADRAALAAKLDESEARAKVLTREVEEREARIQTLSQQTRAELDGTIQVLRDVLGG